MIIRNFYFQIVIRTLLIVAVSACLGWLVASGMSFSLIFAAGIIDTIFIFLLIHFLNSTNRRISYFLESVQNDDSTLTIPTNISDKSILGIYQGLNKVNRQIQQLKIESRQQEQYFETLLEHVATGILTYNAEGFVLHANSAAKKMLGVDVLTHLHQLERVNRNLFQTVKNIGPFEQRLISVTSERGVVQLSLKSTSFKVKNNELILLSIQDIRNELDEKELDSWMKLIRVLMHEIMNSIAPITSLSESLFNFFTIDGRPATPEELSESKIQATLRGLNVIKEQGNGLMLFVESYRKLTRLPKPNKKLFRFEELATRIKVLYSSLENSNMVKLSVVINPPELELFADENLISQVLLNLTKNALQANEKNPEGKISIIAGTNQDRRLEVRVIDNGPGIAEDILEQIFVPFFTTKESGSGIGLSLSRQIMRLHGGTLHARSIPGKETVFSMIF
ncbi:MAG TPA: ATP-binding protein [Prolixibacteraceae bacterium]|nr:ATP-binding protein [Prolixibacteraceae bacterium]HPR84891.1 ATP-binding protein [Prolixibacteraceae bacterium]